MLSLERQNEFRDRYRLEHPGWRPATEVFADLVREHLRPDSRVLDLGCGRGGLVEQLKHPLELIVGLDPDQNSLRQHRLAHEKPPLPRTAGQSRYLPFTHQSFDLLYASWVLEHLAEPELDFHQIGRILQPNGVFIFITPNKRHPLSQLNNAMGQFGAVQDRIVQGFYGRASADSFATHYRANTEADLARLAQVGNMELVQLFTIPDPTYLALRSSMFRLACWLENRLPSERHIHLVGIARRR